MEEDKKIRGPVRTGLAKHGHTVSLAPARAVSSHARRLYGSRYAGRYRYSRLIFAFDLLLLAVVAVLGVFDFSLLYRSYLARPSGLELVFEAPAIQASDLLPIQLTVRSTDGKTHDGVRLHWHLPPWVEILEAYPRLDGEQAVDLGTINPRTEARSRLVAKVRGQVGEKASFGFTVTQYDPLVLAVSYVGNETRAVERTALTVRAAVPGAAYQAGSSVPLIVENAGRATAQAVTLRLAALTGAVMANLGQDGNFGLGDLGPGTKRVVFLHLGPEQVGDFAAGLELQDAAQVVQRYALSGSVVSLCDAGIERAALIDGKFAFDYRTAGKARVLASSGGSGAGAPPFQEIRVEAPEGSYRQDQAAEPPAASWDLVPIGETGAKPCVGRRVSAVAADALPAQATARYFSATGDQLGVGPLPPRVGERTTFWVVWSLGPFPSDLSKVRISADLPGRTAATGKFAAGVAGEFGFTDGGVTWKADELKMAGAERVDLAFEVALTPGPDQVGAPAPLLGRTRLQAVTTQGHVLDVHLPAVDTALQGDAKAQGPGKVER